jgi:uncharacterized protein
MNALIIFARTPIIGKVKTRVAAESGGHFALKLHNYLLSHTLSICNIKSCKKFLFLSDPLLGKEQDFEGFNILFQEGSDLGIRMSHAAEMIFQEGFQKVIIIGSDCLDLTSDIINEAFNHLDSQDIVLGPAFDGGYYLIGMKEFQSELFKNIPWSTSEVLPLTLKKCHTSSYQVKILKKLNDIDHLKDFPVDKIRELS